MLISCPFYLHNTHTTLFRLVLPLLVEFVVSMVYASVSLRALAILYVNENKDLFSISSIFHSSEYLQNGITIHWPRNPP